MFFSTHSRQFTNDALRDEFSNMFETLERADWDETLCSLEYLNAELIALNSIESQKQVIQHALKIYPENGALYLILAELLFKNSETVPAHHALSLAILLRMILALILCCTLIQMNRSRP